MQEVDQPKDLKIAAREKCGFNRFWSLRTKTFADSACPATDLDFRGIILPKRSCRIITMIKADKDPKQIRSLVLRASSELTKRFGDQAEICQVVRWALENVINTPQSQEK